MCAFLITDIIVRKPQKTDEIIYENGTVSDITEKTEISSQTKIKKSEKSTTTHKEKNVSSRTKTTATKASTATETKATETSAGFPIDINKATFRQLVQIPDIGDTTAGKIIEFRNIKGIITNLEQLCEIDGIGEKTVAKLKKYLYVSQNVYKETTSQTSVQTTFSVSDTTKNTAGNKSHKTATTTTTTTVSQQRKSVNINTADAEEIEKSLLIDKELAENIITLRKQISYFSNPLELLYATGMTEKLLGELIPYIEINNGT